MTFTTASFLEVAVESSPELKSNPRPLHSVQTLQPTKLLVHECDSHSELALYNSSNFTFYSVLRFNFCHYHNRNFAQVIT